uniref:ARAD1A07854p n=1 Tax=Blastobotrys adeninivorans TaxID=409370 RepID=A0A060SXA6_BLAAD
MCRAARKDHFLILLELQSSFNVSSFTMSIVLPGDPIEVKATLGPGIYQVPLSSARPSVAGVLETRQKRGTEIVYIDSNSRRYVPSLKDNVVGVVIGKHSEGYRVQLQDHSPPVRLDQFAFENATKKNKPNLALGALVYGRISVAERDIEAEMECFDATTGKSGGFGELKGGNVFNVSLGYARKLLFEGSPVLNEIGQRVPYEIAIGMNGKVWVDAPDMVAVLKICRCIQQAESMASDEAVKNVAKVFQSSSSTSANSS